MPDNLCVIPARGGSKRIPRKNIRSFLGKPILAYSIEAAVASGLFAEIMVSTEDREIAEIALLHGASVPFLRSCRTADDHATTMEVLQEVVEAYRSVGRHFQNLCCIYPTAVFCRPEDLNEGYLRLAGQDMVLPVSRFSFPPQRAFRRSESGHLVYAWPEHALARSQDLPPLYHDAGQWYWFHVDSIGKDTGDMVRGFIELSEMRVQDIDTEDDWLMAEWKFGRFAGQG